MTATTARSIANVAVATAVVAAAYVTLTTPPLRRLVFRGIRLWLGASVPVYLVREVRRAWAESDRSTPDAAV